MVRQPNETVTAMLYRQPENILKLKELIHQTFYYNQHIQAVFIQSLKEFSNDYISDIVMESYNHYRITFKKSFNKKYSTVEEKKKFYDEIVHKSFSILIRDYLEVFKGYGINHKILDVTHLIFHYFDINEQVIDIML